MTNMRKSKLNKKNKKGLYQYEGKYARFVIMMIK